MADSILPFSPAKSNEKLTSRGVEKFGKAVGLSEKVEEKFPVPDPNRGIDPSAYVRTLIYHFQRVVVTLRAPGRSRSKRGFGRLSVSGRWSVPTRLASSDRKLRRGKRRFGVVTICWRDAIWKKPDPKWDSRRGKEESEGEDLDSGRPSGES